MRPNPGKAAVAGLVATAVLTLIMYFVAPLMLGGPMDVAAMLGGLLGVSFAVGMIVHFINGTIIFPLVYTYALYNLLPGAPWVKGLTWGAILWLVAEVAVVPLAGGGLFHSEAGGMMAAVASLAGHLVYGALFGALAGGPAAAKPAAPPAV